MISRRFVTIEEGQVHLREAGAHHGGRPFVMLHASPGSSWSLIPLIERFSETRHVIALDTLGNGDSPPPRHSDRSIQPFADAHLRALDALGVGDFDLYGSHTGGSIASEIAIAHPDRVNCLIFDGMSYYTPEMRDEMLENYAPGISVDYNGQHVQWIWNFVRDTYVYWPWYRRSREARRDVPIPSADHLHDKAIEVLKSARSYHLPYQAAIAYNKTERLPLIRVPTFLTCSEQDMFAEYFETVRQIIPDSEATMTPGFKTPERAERTVALMTDFLNRHA